MSPRAGFGKNFGTRLYCLRGRWHTHVRYEEGMKIVFVDDVIYGYASGASVVGGAERQQWLLARALATTGWSVTVGVREALAAGERRTIDGVEFLGIGRGYIGIGRDHIHLVWYRFLSSEQPDWWYWRCADHLLGSAVEVAKLARVRTIFAAC